ncbi:MAG: hypothetical protein ACR2IA_08640 [Pyrinomonadaceae bacterium]
MNFLPLIFIVFLFLILGCSGDNLTSNSNHLTNRPMEEKLYFLDTNKVPNADDIDTKRIRYLLDYIAARCSNSRDEIGEIANTSVQTIENNRGRKITRQQFLETSRELLDESLKDKKFTKNQDGKIEFGAIAGTVVLSIK